MSFRKLACYWSIKYYVSGITFSLGILLFIAWNHRTSCRCLIPPTSLLMISLSMVINQMTRFLILESCQITQRYHQPYHYRIVITGRKEVISVSNSSWKCSLFTSCSMRLLVSSSHSSNDITSSQAKEISYEEEMRLYIERANHLVTNVFADPFDSDERKSRTEMWVEASTEKVEVENGKEEEDGEVDNPAEDKEQGVGPVKRELSLVHQVKHVSCFKSSLKLAIEDEKWFMIFLYCFRAPKSPSCHQQLQ